MTDTCPALHILRGAMGRHLDGPRKGELIQPRHVAMDGRPDVCRHCKTSIGRTT